MTSVLSTINPLFERNQTLTRSIYTTFQRSKREGGLKDSANVLTNVAETAALEFNDEDLVFNTSEGNNKFAVSKAGNVSVSNNLSVAGVLTLKDSSVSNIVDNIVDVGSSGELPTTAAVVKKIQTTTADLETDIINLDKDIGDLEKLKADKSYVDTQLELKADQTTINDLDRDIGNLETEIDNLTTEIGTKADKSYVDAQLALKADKTTTNALDRKIENLKIDVNTLTMETGTKADKSYVDAQLAGDISANKLNSATTIEASGAISGLSLLSQNVVSGQVFKPKLWVEDFQLDYGQYLQFYGLVNTEVYNDAGKMQYIDKDKMAPSVALIDNKLSTINSNIDLKANTSDVYSKTEVDNKITAASTGVVAIDANKTLLNQYNQKYKLEKQPPVINLLATDYLNLRIPATSYYAYDFPVDKTKQTYYIANCVMILYCQNEEELKKLFICDASSGFYLYIDYCGVSKGTRIGKLNNYFVYQYSINITGSISPQMVQDGIYNDIGFAFDEALENEYQDIFIATFQVRGCIL